MPSAIQITHSKAYSRPTIHCPNVGSMLVQRLRRWPNIEPALGLCIVSGRWRDYVNCPLSVTNNPGPCPSVMWPTQSSNLSNGGLTFDGAKSNRSNCLLYEEAVTVFFFAAQYVTDRKIVPDLITKIPFEENNTFSKH